MKLLFFILILSMGSALNAFEGVARVIAENEAEKEPSKIGELTDDLFNISLEDLMFIKVSGSTLTEKSLKDVPSAVTVFSHEEIKHLGLDYLHELMNLVPGFQSFRSSYSPQLSSFSSRGRTVGGLGAEVLVLIDGQRIDEPRTSGSVIVGAKISLIQVERVEFIRGPGSAVYGSNAMLGVVNIITRNDVNEVGASLGSFNHQQAYVFASQKFKQIKIDIFVQQENDDGDDFNLPDSYSNDRIDSSDPIEAGNINIKLNWQDTQLNFQHYQTQAQDFYMFGTLSNGFNQGESRFDSFSVNQDFNWLTVDSWVRLSVHQSSFDISGQLTAPGDLASVSTPTSNDALFSQVNFKNYQEQRIHWHNDWKINKQASLQAGMEFRQLQAPEVIATNNFDLADLANGDPVRYYGTLEATTAVQQKSSRDIVGLYSQYQQQLTPTTNLILGARYDNFSKIGEKLSPRFGLVHQLNGQNSLKLLYGQAFRAPAENELNLLNNPVIIGDPDLEAETVETWELIWIKQSAHLGISAGYFENHFEDSIQRTRLSADVSQFSNIDQGPVKGIELEVSYEFNPHWLLHSSYTYLAEKPGSSFRETDHLASFTLNYQQSNWNGNLAGSYFGERDMSTGGSDDNLINLDSYWQLYAKLIYRFSHDLQGYMQIKNLLDDQYESAPYNADQVEGIPNRARQILMGLSWGF